MTKQFEEWLFSLKQDGMSEILSLFWQRLKQELPNLPDPAAMPLEDGSVQMCWDRGEHCLTIDVFPNNTYEWFYHNRFVKSSQCEEMPVYFFPAAMLERLQLLCPVEPDNDLC